MALFIKVKASGLCHESIIFKKSFHFQNLVSDSAHTACTGARLWSHIGLLQFVPGPDHTLLTQCQFQYITYCTAVVQFLGGLADVLCICNGVYDKYYYYVYSLEKSIKSEKIHYIIVVLACEKLKRKYSNSYTSFPLYWKQNWALDTRNRKLLY